MTTDLTRQVRALGATRWLPPFVAGLVARRRLDRCLALIAAALQSDPTLPIKTLLTSLRSEGGPVVQALVALLIDRPQAAKSFDQFLQLVRTREPESIIVKDWHRSHRAAEEACTSIGLTWSTPCGLRFSESVSTVLHSNLSSPEFVDGTPALVAERVAERVEDIGGGARQFQRGFELIIPEEIRGRSA